MKVELICALCLAWSNSQQPTSRRLGELPGISEPHSLIVVDDDLVFLDGHTIHVYSLEPLEPKHTFAGPGDGPGQFKYWPRMTSHGDTLVGSDFLKTSFFTLQGELLGTLPYSDFEDFETAMEMVLAPVGENFVRITVDHDAGRRYVRLLDRDLNLIRPLYEGVYDWRGALPAFRIDVASDGEHIVVSDSGKGFFLQVFDAEGTLLHTIDKSGELEPVPFTAADREAYLESVRLTRDPRIHEQLSQRGRFKESFPPINHVQIDGGKLYVTTNRMSEGNHELLVLDLEGRILNRIFLPLRSMSPSRPILRFDPYVLHGGKLYEIVRSETTGSWELWVTDVDESNRPPSPAT